MTFGSVGRCASAAPMPQLWVGPVTVGIEPTTLRLTAVRKTTTVLRDPQYPGRKDFGKSNAPQRGVCEKIEKSARAHFTHCPQIRLRPFPFLSQHGVTYRQESNISGGTHNNKHCTCGCRSNAHERRTIRYRRISNNHVCIHRCRCALFLLLSVGVAPLRPPFIPPTVHGGTEVQSMYVIDRGIFESFSQIQFPRRIGAVRPRFPTVRRLRFAEA